MSRIFDVVQSLSGQKNSLVIPRPYLAFFKGDQQAYQLAAVLNQLVFWSGCSTQHDGWFYKTHEELAEEVSLSADQVRRVVDKLVNTYLLDVIETANRRVNGDKVKHYRIDGSKLIEVIFPENGTPKESPNRNGEAAEPEQQNRQTGLASSPFDGGEVATPIPYTDLYTDPKHIRSIVPSADVTPKPANSYSDEFETAWSKYPKREGSNPKRAAYKAWSDRIKEGVTAGAMLAGVNSYASFCSQKKQLNTTYVMQAKRFFGSDREFESDWSVIPTETPVIDTAERDAAYIRFTTGVGQISNPSPLELCVIRAAGPAGIKTINKIFAVPRWNSLWAEASKNLNVRERDAA